MTLHFDRYLDHCFDHSLLRRGLASLGLVALVALAPHSALALGSPDATQSGSVGLEGTISAPAPTQAATITTPSSGSSVSTTPVTVAGLCKTGLLVKVFSNNVFVGSAVCGGGSYSLKVDLFSGHNDLVARVYDSLDQAGPDSNVASVLFNDAQFAQFGSRVSLSSSYARRGANPGSQLVWPIILSGGSGPYAISVDWGDGQAASLLSESFAGNVDISHTYASAGVYNVVVKATDSTGTNAYLQLVGVANGEASGTVSSSGSSAGGGTTAASGNGLLGKYGGIALAALVPLMIVTFWLGSRHELFTIRRRIERSREQAGS